MKNPSPTNTRSEATVPPIAEPTTIDRLEDKLPSFTSELAPMSLVFLNSSVWLVVSSKLNPERLTGAEEASRKVKGVVFVTERIFTAISGVEVVVSGAKAVVKTGSVNAVSED